MNRRILVCGGRSYGKTQIMREVLASLAGPDDAPGSDPVTIVHGNAIGADRYAALIAEELGYRVEPHPANWTRYGRSAGVIRNSEMLTHGEGVVLVIAFPGGRGTDDMVRQALKAGVKVLRVGERHYHMYYPTPHAKWERDPGPSVDSWPLEHELLGVPKA